MGHSYKKLRFHTYCSLKLITLLLFLFISPEGYTGGLDNSDLYNQYVMTEREKCEIQKLWSIEEVLQDRKLNNNDIDCDQVELFKPIMTLKVGAKHHHRELFLANKENKDWHFPDLHLETEVELNHIKIQSFSFNNVAYNLYEYIPANNNGYDQITIGNVGDIVVVELHDQSIMQLYFIPTLCEDRTEEYNLAQIFSWYPPFRGESYSKSYITTPSCI